MNSRDEFCKAFCLPQRFIAEFPFPANACFLIAQGRCLIMVNVRKPEILASFQVFPSDTVHGVSVSRGLLCCFGNRSFRAGIIVRRRNSFILRLFPKVHRTQDWILQTKIATGGIILLLTMHNSIIEFEAGSSKSTERQCEMRCVSYSGRIYGDSNKNLCVVSGTAKGSVLIWLPCEENVKVAHVLCVHRGAIFDVAFCFRKRLLCSVSDDRSCSVWKMQAQDNPGESELPTVMDWRRARFVSLFVVYGHSARIWRAEFSIHGLLSAGEDGLVILWSDRGDVLWAKRVSRTSLRALYVNDMASFVLVGADSGAIIRLPLWPMAATYRLGLKYAVDHSSESMVQVHLLNSKPLSFLCASNVGNVFIHDVDGERLIVSDHNLRLFVSCKSIIDGLVVFGGLNGAFYLLYNGKLNDCSYATRTVKKIFSIHAIDSENKFLVCADDGRMLLFDCSSRKTAAPYCSELLLPTGRQRWTGAALLVQLNGGKRKLVVGDRNGSVHFYSLEYGISFPQQAYIHVHGRRKVTDFCLANGLLFSVGRNSMLCMWKEDATMGTFELLSKESWFKGLDWPDRFLSCKQGLRIAGFHGDKFLIYDSQLHDAIIEISCGGGHRSYDVKLSEQGDSGCFVFISHGHLSFAHWRHSANVLAQGSHCRRINDVCFAKSYSDKDMIVATCSDDNAIMLWRIDKEIKLLQRLVGHVSSVFCLHGEGDFIFSAGGRAELLVWRFLAGRFCLANRIKDSSDYRFTSMSCQRLSSANARWLIMAARSDAMILAYHMLISQDGSPKLNLVFKFSCLSTVFDAKLVRSGEAAIAYAIVCSSGSLRVKNIATETVEGVLGHWDFKYEIQSCALTTLSPVYSEDRVSFESLIFAVGTESGELYLLELCDRNSIKRLEPAFASSVSAMKCTPNGLLVAISAEERLHIWHCRPELPCCYGKLCLATVLDVSDPSSLCLRVTDTRLDVIVCGIGMQCIRLELRNFLCTQCIQTICLPRR